MQKKIGPLQGAPYRKTEGSVYSETLLADVTKRSRENGAQVQWTRPPASAAVCSWPVLFQLHPSVPSSGLFWSKSQTSSINISVCLSERLQTLETKNKQNQSTMPLSPLNSICNVELSFSVHYSDRQKHKESKQLVPKVIPSVWNLSGYLGSEPAGYLLYMRLKPW